MHFVEKFNDQAAGIMNTDLIARLGSRRGSGHFISAGEQLEDRRRAGDDADIAALMRSICVGAMNCLPTIAYSPPTRQLVTDRTA